MSFEQKTIEVLAQFGRDLEVGDLSSYRITKWVACSECHGEGWGRAGCWKCKGIGAIQVVVQEGK